MIVRALLLALSFLALNAGPLQAKWLITPDEAARAGQAAPLEPLSTEQGVGPAIIVASPKALERMHAPVDIQVSFAPGASGSPPDMASLTVTLRGFITIDITDRLREYIKGHSLAVEGADLPSGTHRIRMAIADRAGNLSARDVVLTVIDEPR